MDLRDVITSALRDALTFWLPVACAGCGVVDTTLCPGCRCALAPRPVRRSLAPGLTVTSALVFDGIPARVIRALKEEGSTCLLYKSPNPRNRTKNRMPSSA